MDRSYKSHNDVSLTRVPTVHSICSRDVLLRWAMPVVPDANMIDDSYTYHRGNIYIDRDVSLARCVNTPRGRISGPSHRWIFDLV